MQRLLGILCHTTSQVTAEFFCAIGLEYFADFGDLDWCQVGSRRGGGGLDVLNVCLHLHQVSLGQVECFPLAWDSKALSPAAISVGDLPLCWKTTVE